MEFALLADKAAQQVSVFLLHAVLSGGAPSGSLALKSYLCVDDLPSLRGDCLCPSALASSPEPCMLLRRPLVTETDWALVPSTGVAEVKQICPWHCSLTRNLLLDRPHISHCASLCLVTSDLTHWNNN